MLTANTFSAIMMGVSTQWILFLKLMRHRKRWRDKSNRFFQYKNVCSDILGQRFRGLKKEPRQNIPIINETFEEKMMEGHSSLNAREWNHLLLMQPTNLGNGTDRAVNEIWSSLWWGYAKRSQNPNKKKHFCCRYRKSVGHFTMQMVQALSQMWYC